MERVFEIESIKEEGNSLTASVKLDKDHAVFEGHFPGKAVLPGVVEIEMVRSVLNKYFDRNYRLKLLKNAKYTAMILPGDVDIITVEIIVDKTDEGLKTKAVIKNDNEVFLKLSGFFA